jgi:hypothetical protein
MSKSVHPAMLNMLDFAKYATQIQSGAGQKNCEPACCSANFYPGGSFAGIFLAGLLECCAATGLRWLAKYLSESSQGVGLLTAGWGRTSGGLLPASWWRTRRRAEPGQPASWGRRVQGAATVGPRAAGERRTEAEAAELGAITSSMTGRVAQARPLTRWGDLVWARE